MEQIQAQIVEAKKRERSEELKNVKELFKEFSFTLGMLESALTQGRKNKLT